ncbi:upstream activation factor subunit spp27 [Punica granatum]|uniref:DM2 domain-containing protein n=2 Tax=Punica granatum TaxID=22663 RepID=A0A218XFK7_PUNGR|nr:upstream activation factor subunit spp27 [Punica granatum]OWM83261.1 hypothetical protein CDL15_Pgr012742 [Punica granatum]PKI48559.1 hypothetical protein CRG98_031041 [Punica granatum]
MSNSSTAMRVFRGCRALLAPAPSSAAAAAKPSKVAAPAKPSKAAPATAVAASSAQEKPKARKKPSPRSTPSRPSGIQKVTPVSPALAEFLKSPEASRSDAVKQIWSYIKLHDLQNPTNKREIFCDEKLKSIFDGKDKVGFLEIGKLLSRHFIKTA